MCSLYWEKNRNLIDSELTYFGNLKAVVRAMNTHVCKIYSCKRCFHFFFCSHRIEPYINLSVCTIYPFRDEASLLEILQLKVNSKFQSGYVWTKQNSFLLGHPTRVANFLHNSINVLNEIVFIIIILALRANRLSALLQV